MTCVRRVFSGAGGLPVRVLGVSLLLLLAALLAPQGAQAGTTGKIAGKITDATTGEPIPAVNVVVEGTQRGAATDLDGHYFIINLDPDTYTLRVSAVGYANQVVTDVQVSVDKTTTIDLQLQPEAIQGETITVVAKRPLIEPDRTFSLSSVDDKDLQVMPITRVNEAVELQAGVVDGHFRGGRTGEVMYLVDGIPVVDSYDNSQSTQVSHDVVKELQVITGNFNAEYGQAMSGVVNIVTKDGGEEYHGSVSVQMGDYVSDHTEQFYNIDDIDPTSISNNTFSLSGPMPFFNRLRFYVNGRYENNRGWLYGQNKFDVEYLDEFLDWVDALDEMPPADQAAEFDRLGLDPNLANDLEGLYLAMLEREGQGDGSFQSMNPDENLYLFGKLSYQLTDKIKLNYITMWEDRNYRDFDREFINIPDGDFQRFKRARTNNVKMTAAINQAMFAELGFSNTFNEYYHHVYEDVYDPRYYYQFNLMEINPSYTTNVSGVKFEHFRRYTDTNSLQGKLSWQVTPVHYIVAGANANLSQLYYQSINDDITDVGPTILEYGSLPPVSDFNHDKFRYEPVEAAFYLQDKIELDRLIVNAGVRLDYFDSNGKVLADPKDPDVYHPIQNGVDQTAEQRQSYWYEDPEAKFQFSPRLGIGYPISANGVLHFAYGHFFQRPRYEYLFANPEFEIKRKGAGLHTLMGNANLDAEKTISYEFGFDQALTDDITLGLNLYQRDIRGLISADRIVETYQSGVFYAQYVNRDIAEVRGVTFTLNKRYSNNISAGLDYTYQIAEGVASDPQDAYNAQSGDSNRQPVKQLIPLNWDRRHTLNVNVNYVVPQNYGVSFIGTIGSGTPFTIESGQSKVQDLSLSFENDGRKPTYINVDMSVFKQLPVFKQWGVNARVELVVRNLFDRLNENDVHKDTGRATYRTDIPDNNSGENPEFNTFDEFFLYYPQYYSRPREVRLGLTIEF